MYTAKYFLDGEFSKIRILKSDFIVKYSVVIFKLVVFKNSTTKNVRNIFEKFIIYTAINMRKRVMYWEKKNNFKLCQYIVLSIIDYFFQKCKKIIEFLSFTFNFDSYSQSKFLKEKLQFNWFETLEFSLFVVSITTGLSNSEILHHFLWTSSFV